MLCVFTWVMCVVRTAYFFTGDGDFLYYSVNLLYLAKYKVAPSQSSICRKISLENMS
jgi:hypothetical protein